MARQEPDKLLDALSFIGMCGLVGLVALCTFAAALSMFLLIATLI